MDCCHGVPGIRAMSCHTRPGHLLTRHPRTNQASGGDLENLSAKLATVAKEKVPPLASLNPALYDKGLIPLPPCLAVIPFPQGSSDNITIVVVLLKPLQEIVCPPLCPDQVSRALYSINIFHGTFNLFVCIMCA